MSDGKIVMQVPQDIIDAHVRAAVAAVLSRDPAKLIEAVVDAAINQKNNSYDRTTLFEQQINKMIRDEGVAVFQLWLEEQKPKIRAAVLARLKQKEKFIDGIADKLVSSLQSNFHVSVSVTDRITEED